MTYVYRYYFGKRKKYGRIFNEEIGCQKLDMRVDEYMGPFVSGTNLNFFILKKTVGIQSLGQVCPRKGRTSTARCRYCDRSTVHFFENFKLTCLVIKNKGRSKFSVEVQKTVPKLQHSP